MALTAGAQAPDVTFTTHDRKDIPVSSFKGRQTLVLAFYPRAFTGG